MLILKHSTTSNLLKGIWSTRGLRFNKAITLFSNKKDNQNDSTSNPTPTQPTSHYTYPYNFNRQQYRGYIKKVQKAQKAIAQNQQLEQQNKLPRRKRRIYDRPRFDRNTEGYSAWRLYDPQPTQMKTFPDQMIVQAKIHLQPKWVKHAFGQGIISINNLHNSDRQYVFEDVNLSAFLLYEYRNTTSYKENDPEFDYEHQDHLRPQLRKRYRLSPQEFWNSEEKFEFRLNATCYAEKFKFLQWVEETIEKRKTQESYDEMIDKKFSKAFAFNEKSDCEMFKPREPFIKFVKPSSFDLEVKGQGSKKKGKKSEKEPASDSSVGSPVTTEPQKSAYEFASQLPEEYRRPKTTQKKQATAESK